MARAKGPMDPDRFTIIGRSHGSDDVALEAGEALTRWTRDSDALAEHGFGPEELAVFERYVLDHTNERAARPDGVAAKKNQVKAKRKDIRAGWAWVDKAARVIGRVARVDADVATSLEQAVPSDDAGLGAGIGALATLMESVRTRVPASANVEARLAEAPELRTRIEGQPGAVHAAKAAAKSDTAALDLLDGQIYVTIVDLNDAARSAIRNGDLRADPSDYRLHHLAASPTAPAGSTGGGEPVGPTVPTP